MQNYLTSKCKNFLRKKAVKVSLKTEKRQELNRKWWTREFQYFSHGRHGSCWSGSFFLFVQSSNQRSERGTKICIYTMYLFVMLLFSNRNTLDRSTKHLISNLTSHTTIDGLLQWKRNRRWNKIPNWTMLYPQINMFQLVWRAEKGNVYSA